MLALVLITLSAALLLVALVLNWAYLVLVQRDAQQRADILALAAAAELLDEDLLDSGIADQDDDVIDAEATLAELLVLNNQTLGQRLRLAGADIGLTPGRLTSWQAAGAAFTDAAPYSALRIDVTREPHGGNPVSHLLSGLWGARDKVRVAATTIAALDNRLLGFRPRGESPSPLVPIAISIDAWENEPRADSFPLGGNARAEFIIRLASGAETLAANAVLVSFDGPIPGSSVTTSQIVGGVYAGDLAGGALGPARSSQPLHVAAVMEVSDSAAADLAGALITVAEMADSRRVFPLFTTFSAGAAEADLIGFIAARIIDAELIDPDADPQTDDDYLKVTIEPDFLVHTTAWTGADGEPSVFIHKLRLIR